MKNLLFLTLSIFLAIPVLSFLYFLYTLMTGLARIQRIKQEGYVLAATAGKLPFQRKR